MNKIYSLYICIAAFAIIGCAQQQDETATIQDLQKERYYKLLVQDSLEVIDFDFSKQTNEQVSQIEFDLGFNLCYNDAEFAIKLPDSSFLECFVEHECDSLLEMKCSPVMWDYEVLMNWQGRCLVNNIIVYIEDIKQLLAHEFPDTMKHTTEGVTLQWDRDVPKDSLDKLLLNIKNGFIKHAELKSRARFGSKIESLTDEQFESLLMDSDYYIYLALKPQAVPALQMHQ